MSSSGILDFSWLLLRESESLWVPYKVAFEVLTGYLYMQQWYIHYEEVLWKITGLQQSYSGLQPGSHYFPAQKILHS